MNTALIVFLVALFLWYVSIVLGTYIWIFDADRDIMFWPGLLMFTPVVNTIFLVVLAIKFKPIPKGFFDIHELTDAFKK